MHVELAAEHIFNLFGLPITNAIFTSWLVMVVMISLAIVLRTQLKPIPGKLQSVFEIIYLYFLDTAETIIGRRDVAKEIFPYVITLFLYIVFSNWSELLPGNVSIGVIESTHAASEGAQKVIPLLRPPSTDLNAVAGLALISVVYVQYLGLKHAGKAYVKKFFNFSSPIMFFVGILELISEISRVVSYSFRLFGNIFAGEVLMTVMFFLTLTLLPAFPILPLPFYFLEIFVGGIQAFVFCSLFIVLTAVAVNEHGH